MAQVIRGRHQLIAHLGGGANSDVSLARTEPASDLANLATFVVVKRLKLGADGEPEAVALFAEEARLSRRLNHRNVVRAYEAGDDADGPYLLLEYLEGQSLARIRSRARRRGTGLPRPIALQIVKEMASGLAYAHGLEEAGKPLKIIHRDASPENVVVTYAGTTKLIDFSGPVAPPRSRGRAHKGSVAYIAPEQARTDLKLDVRVDVFATGLVLWELLAGQRMWEGMSEAEVLARLADAAPLPALRTVVPDLPADLDAICTQALAKVRDDRYDSCAELRDALEKASATPELRTTAREVADFVTSLFEPEREKMRAVVDEARMRGAAGPGATPAEGTEVLPRLGPSLATSSTDRFMDVESAPSLATAAITAPTAPAAPAAPAAPIAPAAPAPTPALAPAPAARVVEVLRVEQGPSRDRRFALAIGGAVLLAFAGVALVALTSQSGPDKSASTPPHVARPTATPTEPPPALEVEPEEVAIEISVKPNTARLFVDGIKASLNPHRVKVVRGKYTHAVRAEADGFDTRTMNVVFDRDRSIDIVLTPKTPVGLPAPPPRAGSPSRPLTDADAPKTDAQ